MSNIITIQTEEGPLEIPLPNLSGDDVRFVRYDEAGNIVSYGNMHRDHIKNEADQGGKIFEHDVHDISLSEHKVDVAKRKIVRKKADKLSEAKTAKADDIGNAIKGLLNATDKYFLADALENITQQEQDQWREFRKQVRAAARMTDPDQMIAAIPPTPKGEDLIFYLRPNAKIMGI